MGDVIDIKSKKESDDHVVDSLLFHADGGSISGIADCEGVTVVYVVNAIGYNGHGLEPAQAEHLGMELIRLAAMARIRDKEEGFEVPE